MHVCGDATLWGPETTCFEPQPVKGHPLARLTKLGSHYYCYYCYMLLIPHPKHEVKLPSKRDCACHGCFSKPKTPRHCLVYNGLTNSFVFIGISTSEFKWSFENVRTLTPREDGTMLDLDWTNPTLFTNTNLVVLFMKVKSLLFVGSHLLDS